MNKELFDELQRSVGEGMAIMRGRRKVSVAAGNVVDSDDGLGVSPHLTPTNPQTFERKRGFGGWKMVSPRVGLGSSATPNIDDLNEDLNITTPPLSNSRLQHFPIKNINLSMDIIPQLTV